MRSPAPSSGEISSWASIDPLRALRKRAEMADADAGPATPSARTSRSIVACPRRTSHGSLSVFGRSARTGRRRTLISDTDSFDRSTVRDRSAMGDQERSTESAENQTPDASRISIEPTDSEDRGSPSSFRTLRRPYPATSRPSIWEMTKSRPASVVIQYRAKASRIASASTSVTTADETGRRRSRENGLKRSGIRRPGRSRYRLALASRRPGGPAAWRYRAGWGRNRDSSARRVPPTRLHPKTPTPDHRSQRRDQ